MKERPIIFKPALVAAILADPPRKTVTRRVIRLPNHNVNAVYYSIHMPKWASRLTLEVTNVRAERLQEITEKDAKAEGVDPLPTPSWLAENQRAAAEAAPYVLGFSVAWDAIYGARAPWVENPWVWRVAFKVVPAEAEIWRWFG